MRRIRVITFRVGEPARVEEIDGSGYKGLGAIVGGWIERVPNAYWERPDEGDDGLDLFCNEEGLLIGLPKQVREELGQRAPLAGNLVLARSNADGDTVSVNDADVARYAGGAP